MDTAEIAKILNTRNFAPENLELAAKMMAIDAAGVGGIRYQGATIALSKRHTDCIEVIAMGDGGGRLGARAWRKCVENLLHAEEQVRREAEKLIREYGLDGAWQKYLDEEGAEDESDAVAVESDATSTTEYVEEAHPTAAVDDDADASASEDLLAVVQARYARGEITRDEYLQLTQDLGLAAT